MIGIIANGRAGSAQLYESAIREVSRQVRGIVRVPQNWSDLDRTIEEFWNAGVNHIVTLGGDGTNHQVITRVHNAYDTPVHFSFLGKGTQNLMRRYMGLKDMCPQEQLERIANNEVRQVAKRLLHVTTEHNSHYGFLFGVALPQQFMARYYDENANRFKTIGKVLWGALVGNDYTRSLAAPTSAVIQVDGGALDVQDYTVVLAGTIRNVDPAHSPLYRADGKKSKDAHLITSTEAPTKIVRDYFGILRGRPLRAAHHDCTFKRVDISGKGLDYMIDGDLQSDKPYRADHITLEPGPYVSILVPTNGSACERHSDY